MALQDRPSPQTNQSVRSSPASPATNVTTPEQSPGNDEDIWDDGGGNADDTSAQHQREMLSDLPTIRRQHMTDGYREGLAVGKAKVIQEGFDQGYPIGVEIGLRVGSILGILEGYLSSKSISLVPEMKEGVQKVYTQAQSELAIPQLLKGLDDETVAAAKIIPTHIEAVLQPWESLVHGILQTRNATPRQGQEQGSHE